MSLEKEILDELQNPSPELIYGLYITPIAAIVVMAIILHPAVESRFQVMIPVDSQRIIAKLLLLLCILYIVNVILYRTFKQ